MLLSIFSLLALLFSGSSGYQIKSNLKLSEGLAQHWFPVHFKETLLNKKNKGMAPFELFGDQWLLWREEVTGGVSCILDQCAHRAARLSQGTVKEKCLQCPYHGWEFGSDGNTKHTPQVRHRRHASVRTLPVREYEGLFWVWAGDPDNSLEREKHWKSILGITTYPSGEGFSAFFKVDKKFPVEHGLFIENGFDLAHFPITHEFSPAKKWDIPEELTFEKEPGQFASNVTNATGVEIAGYWRQVPFDHGFHPPCIVLARFGAASMNRRGESKTRCEDYRRQFHFFTAYLPNKEGHVRILQRVHTNFLGFTRYVPFFERRIERTSGKVLQEDVDVLQGIQENIQRHGDNVGYQSPCAYDQASILYREWRNRVDKSH